MKFRRITALAAAATLSGAIFAGVPLLAHAAAETDVASQVVRYDDLNLAGDAGVQALYRRIRNAAETVCGPASLIASRIVSENWKDCVGASVRQAIFAVNKPQLTAYYAAHLRVPVAPTRG